MFAEGQSPSLLLIKRNDFIYFNIFIIVLSGLNKPGQIPWMLTKHNKLLSVPVSVG